MKKIAFIIRNDKALLNNKIFESETLYGMKSDNYPFKALKQEFNKFGVEFHTYDILNPNDADAVICLDEVDTYKKLNLSGKKSYLIISEPPVYTPENWDKKNHKYFEKVFTYDSSMCNNLKYEHYTFPIEFEKHPPFIKVNEEMYNNRHLSSIIAGAFQVSKPNKDSPSLLYERYRLIKWFTKNHPDDLHFFSRNLSSKIFEYFRGAGILNKLKLQSIVKKIAIKNFTPFKITYKGAIPPLEKIVKQQEYNFSFCYENSKGINGCISERIFDCFAAASVPIYFGAPDIEKWIPKNCFIDKRNFNNYNELYQFIKQMPYARYNDYLKSIEDFLNSNKINIFKVDAYANKIVNNINL